MKNLRTSWYVKVLVLDMPGVLETEPIAKGRKWKEFFLQISQTLDQTTEAGERRKLL